MALCLLTYGAEMVLAYSGYRSDIGRAYRRISTGSEIAETLSGPLEYAVKGEGLPLVSVHGAGGGFVRALSFRRHSRKTVFA